MILRKSVQIKDVLPSGLVLVCFSTMGVIDKDGDLTLPGFIGAQDVVMLPAHDWKHVPIGKGVTREVGDQVLADLKMNLDIQSAKDWHSALMFDMKNGTPLQEYSYGFTIKDGGCSEGGEVAGAKAYRTLRPCPDGSVGCKCHEVSPVLVGAGEGTHTLAVKGVKFADETEAVILTVDALIARAKSLADMRAKEDRGLSSVSQERLKSLCERLLSAEKELRGLTPDDVARANSIAARVEMVRHLRTQAGL